LILGLLNTQPQSGYDLKKKFAKTVQNFWSTDQSQIYRALYKLEEKGWIHMEYVVQEDNPDKKLYHVTEAGYDELIRWITTPIGETQSPIREGWLGQLFFGGLVGNDEIISVLEAYRDELEQVVAHLELIHRALVARNDELGGVRDLQLVMMTTDYGLTMQKTALEWIKEAIRQVNQLQLDSKPRNT